MKDVPYQYESLLENVSCNLCGADDYEVIYAPRYEAARPEDLAEVFCSSGDEVLVDQLVRCRRCGLQYLNPRLRRNLILESYSSGSDEKFVSQIEARERTFARSLKRIERLAPQKGRVLDVGTGSGAFLGVAKQRGWEVAGCEPNRWLSEWGSRRYGIHIIPGTVFDMELEESSFDVVTLWDVLEHTPDPRAVLAKCRSVLKPGGLVAINYPDIESLVARLMGRRWVFLLSVHLYYFTTETVKRMLAETDFEVRKIHAHWQSLELGYILFRMKPYVSWLCRLATAIVNGLRMQHVQIPYWMGQVLVLAQRSNS